MNPAPIGKALGMPQRTILTSVKGRPASPRHRPRASPATIGTQTTAAYGRRRRADRSAPSFSASVVILILRSCWRYQPVWGQKFNDRPISLCTQLFYCGMIARVQSCPLRGSRPREGHGGNTAVDGDASRCILRPHASLMRRCRPAEARSKGWRMANRTDQETGPSIGSYVLAVSTSVLIAVLVGAALAIFEVLASKLAILGISTGSFIVTIRLGIWAIPRGSSHRQAGALPKGVHSLNDSQFFALRDADIEERDDAHSHKEIRTIQTEALRHLREGKLVDDDDFELARSNALQAVVEIGALRLGHACRQPATLAIVEDTGPEFIAKRSSQSSIGSRIVRGMRCAHDTSLDTVLSNYADYHYKAEYHAPGRTYYAVALSNTPMSPSGNERICASAVALVEDTATQYQGMYLFFRYLAELRMRDDGRGNESQG